MTQLTQSYWPATTEVALNRVTCGEVLRHAAAIRPTHLALIEHDLSISRRRAYTYGELLSHAEQTSRALLKRYPNGGHIAVWGGNCAEWVMLQYGVALAGMVLVTVNPAVRTAELAYLLRQSRARAVFHAREYRGVTLAELVAQACRDEALTVDAFVLDELLAFAASGDPRTALPVVLPEAPAMIQYTSGTTGRPKGALLNHFSITNNARLMAIIKELNAETVNLAVAPLFHTAGCVANVLGTAQAQGTMVLPPAFDAEHMLTLIERERVTYGFGVPTMLIAMLEAQTRNPRDLNSLQVVFSGATTVPIDLVQRVETQFNVRLIIGYGQTETSPAITHTRLTDNTRDKSETIGQAIPQVEIKIIDPATGATLPVDQPGELCTRGFLVMMGYFEMPEATAATIDAEGWLHTGDLCTMDSRGYCRITGRLKDMIIRGGENIYPREIEEVLFTHPAVSEVAVFGVPDDYWGESVGAAVTWRDSPVTGDALREFVLARLARHKAPTAWFALPQIPATASGKLQKFKLVEMVRGGELESYRI